MQMSNAEYHRSPAIGSSLLSRLAKSPAHAKAYLDNPPEETPAMAFGSAFHTAVLGIDEFVKQYAVFDGSEVWIRNEDGEGGIFSREKFLEAIDAFFLENF